ncbi:MAG: acyltransferase family protein [Chloroflexota bacterium]|nr:MAG: acyltransferase family protein [Chloroflexota bacterium]
MKTNEVLIVARPGLVRDGLVDMVSAISGLESLEPAADGPAAVTRLGYHRQALVLLDASLPEDEALVAWLEIKGRYPDVRGMAIAGGARQQKVLLEAGVQTVFLEGVSPADLAQDIKATANRPEDKGKSGRLHYLDWLRVLAILIVFLFHAVHPFDIADWHIKNGDQSLAVTAFLAFFFPWGMPFFFTLAGAGSWFALQRRTAGQFAAERFGRLLIPFVLGAALLTPLQRFFEWRHRHPGEPLPGVMTTLFDLEEVTFGPKIFGWAGFHLWFLGFLFAFSLLALPLFMWLKGEGGGRFLDRVARLTSGRGGLLLFLVPLLFIQLTIRPLFPAEHDWADFTVQMAFFILGFVLFADQRFQRAIRRDGRPMLVGAAITSLAILAVLALGDPLTWLESPDMPHFYFIWALVSINAWLWTVAVLAIGRRYLNFDHRWQRAGRQVIVPFFALHQPVIVVIAFYVVQMNAGIPLKLPLVVVSAFLVSLGLVVTLSRLPHWRSVITRRFTAPAPEMAQ